MVTPTKDISRILLVQQVDEDGTAVGGAVDTALLTDIEAGIDNINTNLQDTTPAAVKGSDAHDAPITQAPVAIGGVAADAAPTAVSADGDVTRAWVDRYGRVVVAEAPRALLNWTTDTPITNTSATTVVAAGAAGVFRDLTGVMIQNSSATNTTLTFSDGTKSFKIYVPAGSSLVGFVRNASTARKASTAATAWTAQSSDTVASGLSVSTDWVERKA